MEAHCAIGVGEVQFGPSRGLAGKPARQGMGDSGFALPSPLEVGWWL